MASLSMRCATDLTSVDCRHLNHPNRNRNRIGAIGMRMNSRSGPRIFAVASDSSASYVPTMPTTNRPSDKTGPLFSQKVDEWMRDSAVEIVKNLREAPLLVQVYASNNGVAARLQTEKAVAKEWPVVERRWKDGTAPSPDGLILVEELQSNEDLEEEEGTKAWGVVVQGKGSECGPACYLLKTSRVGSGMGLCSTHFCLMKVKNFRESALSQLTKCWLLN